MNLFQRMGRAIGAFFLRIWRAICRAMGWCAVSRKRMLLRFWGHTVIFFTILCFLSTWLLWVLTPKHDYGVYTVKTFYEQPKNSVDLLIMGTSLAYEGINTNVLWHRHGIAAFSLCGVEQPFWNTYYYLEEALKTQRPKLIILDVKAITYPNDYSTHSRTILNTFGIRSLSTRIANMWNSCAPEDFLEYVVGFPQIHGFYEDLGWRDFTDYKGDPNYYQNWKGYQPRQFVDPQYQPNFPWTNEKTTPNARELYWLNRIFDLVQERGLKLLVIAMPNPAYLVDHPYYNNVWEICDEREIPYINFNSPHADTGLDYSMHFGDSQHLNVEGSTHFTVQFGQYLSKTYRFPDRRNDDVYDSWERGYQNWLSTFPQFDYL